ncbi:MarR family transcriptional regulator [Streptomyces sp. NPDC051985]|uniref:MarR family winged helix-turn-helix transcriptional regulator n=1 Tax=Streptomyces sp. NPDC051985 TaxID=3155807 RepID=UPI003414B4CC
MTKDDETTDDKSRDHEMPPPTGGPLDGLLWALRRAELAVQGLKGQRLRSLGMAAAHYSLLVLVRDVPGLTGAEAARRLNVTPQAVASLVARLEGRGQLERRPHPRHGHVQELHLTDAGRELLASADLVVIDIERRLAEHLGGVDTVQLTALLGRVVDAVHEP